MSKASKMPARIWARDLDGTGSMHPCVKGDPGAVEFIRADIAEQMAEALRAIAELSESGDDPIGFATATAHAALSAWEASNA